MDVSSSHSRSAFILCLILFYLLGNGKSIIIALIMIDTLCQLITRHLWVCTRRGTNQKLEPFACNCCRHDRFVTVDSHLNSMNRFRSRWGGGEREFVFVVLSILKTLTGNVIIVGNSLSHSPHFYCVSSLLLPLSLTD